MNKKFEEYTIGELKALAYDELAKVEVAQANIKFINSRIAELSKAKPASEILEEKKDLK